MLRVFLHTIFAVVMRRRILVSWLTNFSGVHFPLWQDLQLSGAPLSKILAAGQGRSAPFLQYLDQCELEREVAFEATVLSDDEEWID